MATNPSRRRFLKLGAAAAVLVGGGTYVYRAVGRFGPPALGWQLFDADEIAILEAACEAHFPGREGGRRNGAWESDPGNSGPPDHELSWKDADCARFVDRYVAGLYPDQQLLLRANLRALNVTTLLTHRSQFKNLSREERYDVLESMASSSLRVRRAGYQSLTFFIKMGYFENERVRESFGFTLGCAVPQEGRPQGI